MEVQSTELVRIFELLDDVLLFLFICLCICDRHDGSTCNGVPEQGRKPVTIVWYIAIVMYMYQCTLDVLANVSGNLAGPMEMYRTTVRLTSARRQYR